MKKIDYYVKVYTGLTDTISSIGMVAGVCTWTSYSGILTRDWCDSISQSVDISVSGNYSRYTDVIIRIVKSAIVETTLVNYGGTLNNCRCEIYETDGIDDYMLWRGVISSISEYENTTEIRVSHVANYYSTNITNRIGDKYTNVVFGESLDYVPLAYVEEEEISDVFIGDDLIPAFEVFSDVDDPYKITLWGVYGIDVVSQADLTTFLNSIYPRKILVTGSKGSLVCEIDMNTISNGSIDRDGTTYLEAIFSAIPIPCNLRDENGELLFASGARGDIGVVSVSKQVTLYNPRGSNLSFDGLYYKDGKYYRKFPSYVDSRVDTTDTITLLDSDDTGYSYVEPVGTGGIVKGKNLINKIDPDFGGMTNRVSGDSEIIVLSSEAITISNLSITANNTNYNSRDNVGSQANVDFYFDITSAPNYMDKLQIIIGFKNTVKFKRSTIPASMYYTGDVRMTRAASPFYDTIDRTVYSKLCLTEDTSLNRYPFTVGDNVYLQSIVSNVKFSEMRFPSSNVGNSSNVRFRYKNEGSQGLYGRSVELLSVIENEFEKTVPIDIYSYVMIVFDSNGYNTQEDGITSIFVGPYSFNVMANCNIVEELGYSTDEIYIKGADGLQTIDSVVADDTKKAYLSVLNLQNYESAGIAIPSSGWGIEYPSGDLSGVVDSSAPIPEIPLQWTTDETNSTDLKYELLKMTNGIGTLDSNGKETFNPIDLYAGGTAFDKTKIVGKPTVRQIDPTRVYSDIGVTYANGQIVIKNTEQQIPPSDYVTGVTSTSQAVMLWFAGNTVYKKYGIKNEYPKKLADIQGIKNESDAITYIRNQYILAGCQFDDANEVVYLRKRYTVTFDTSAEYTFGSGLELGSPITLSYPNIATSETGIITGISIQPDSAIVTIEAEMVGDILEKSNVFDIVESGTRDDDIIESGTRTRNYVEAI